MEGRGKHGKLGLNSAFNVLNSVMVVTIMLIFEDRLNTEKAKHTSCLQHQLKQESHLHWVEGILFTAISRGYISSGCAEMFFAML